MSRCLGDSLLVNINYLMLSKRFTCPLNIYGFAPSKTSKRCETMSVNPLATPCLLYCGSCRYYMTEECRGCGSEDRPDCKIFKCCRTDKKLRFCTECKEFPCTVLKKSVGVHPGWLEDQAKLPLKK